METEIIKLYENYGVLAHEYESAFSATAAAEIHDEIYVELPNVVGETILGEPVVELDGEEYALGDVLTNVGNEPALEWCKNFWPPKKQLILHRVEQK
jgi:hypothetical protein